MPPRMGGGRFETSLFIVCACLVFCVADNKRALFVPNAAVARRLPGGHAASRLAPRAAGRLGLRGALGAVLMFERGRKEKRQEQSGEGQEGWDSRQSADGMAGFAWEGNLVDSPYASGTPLFGSGEAAQGKEEERERTASARTESAFPRDAPVCKHHTIQHWSESEGSSGWALVMPDLSEMQRQLDSLEERAHTLRQRLVSLDGSVCQECVQMRRQLSGLHQRQFMLRHKVAASHMQMLPHPASARTSRASAALPAWGVWGSVWCI